MIEKRFTSLPNLYRLVQGFILFFLSLSGVAQNNIYFSHDVNIIGKFRNAETVAPIYFETDDSNIAIEIANDYLGQMDSTQLADLNKKVKIVKHKVSINNQSPIDNAYYYSLVFDGSYNPESELSIRLHLIHSGELINSTIVTIQPILMDKVQMFRYKTDRRFKLDEVFKVEFQDGEYIVHGRKDSTYEKFSIINPTGIPFHHAKFTTLGKFSSNDPWPVSLTTVPYRIYTRPEIKLDDGTIETKDRLVTSGLSSVGVNFELFRLDSEYYFISGKKSLHRYSLGILATLLVQSTDSTNTHPIIVQSKSSPFLSLGLTLSYSYNGINFNLVPIGKDFGLTSDAKRWIYNDQLWYGIGIGVSPKFIERVFK